MRRALAWIVATALALMGALVGHELAYRVVVPHGHDREHALAASGHAYLDRAPLLFGSLGTVAAIALVLDALVVRRTARQLTWPLALIAPGAFILQEHVERFVHLGQMPWTAGLQATFQVGLLVQAIVGLITWRLARLLLRTARRLVAAVAAALVRVTPRLAAHRPTQAPIHIATLRGSVLLSAAAGRAPPALLRP